MATAKVTGITESTNLLLVSVNGKIYFWSVNLWMLDIYILPSLSSYEAEQGADNAPNNVSLKYRYMHILIHD